MEKAAPRNRLPRSQWSPKATLVLQQLGRPAEGLCSREQATEGQLSSVAKDAAVCVALLRTSNSQIPVHFGRPGTMEAILKKNTWWLVISLKCKLPVLSTASDRSATWHLYG